MLPAGRIRERPSTQQRFKVLNLRDGSGEPYAIVDHQGRIVSRWPGPSRARSEADALRRGGTRHALATAQVAADSDSSSAEAAPVTPAQLAAYLRSRGWRIAGSHRSAPVWAHPRGGARIFAPHAIEYDDDPELIADALAALARHQGRDVPDLTRDITGSPAHSRTACHPPATPAAGLRPPATDAEFVESCARLAGLLRDLAGQLDGWTHALAGLNLPAPVLGPLHAASTAVDGAARHADHAREAFLTTFGAAHQTAASGLRITGDGPA